MKFLENSCFAHVNLIQIIFTRNFSIFSKIEKTKLFSVVFRFDVKNVFDSVPFHSVNL